MAPGSRLARVVVMKSLSTSNGSGRVLIVTPQPFYEDRGTPIAIRYVAQALSQLGAHVDILAFPIGRDVSIPNVHIARCANPLRFRSVPIGFSWRKIALDSSLWQSFTRLIRTANYDVVHAVEEAAYMASFICPHVGVPFIYDMASAIPTELARKSLFKLSGIRSLLSHVEARVIRAASRIVCSTGLADHVLGQDPDANVREWLYPAYFDRTDEHETLALRMDLGLSSDQRMILYSGNLAAYQGVGLLLEAFQRARLIRPELVLVCVGASAKEMPTGAESGKQLDENVMILPRQPREKMPTYLKLADYLVLPRFGADNAPLKLFDYMAAGKPIIATRGAAHEPLLNSSRAFMCDADARSIAAAILKARESPTRAASVAAAAQAYARQHFGWERFVEFVRVMYDDALHDVPNLGRTYATG